MMMMILKAKKTNETSQQLIHPSDFPDLTFFLPYFPNYIVFQKEEKISLIVFENLILDIMDIMELGRYVWKMVDVPPKNSKSGKYERWIMSLIFIKAKKTFSFWLTLYHHFIDI